MHAFSLNCSSQERASAMTCLLHNIITCQSPRVLAVTAHPLQTEGKDVEELMQRNFTFMISEQPFLAKCAHTLALRPYHVPSEQSLQTSHCACLPITSSTT